MNINVGDTVIIRGTVERVSGCEYDALFPLLATVKIPGMVKSIIVPASVFSEVIPKPRLPKSGEIWEVKYSAKPTKRKVYFADDSYVVYEDISNGGGIYKKTITFFLDHFQPET